MRAQRKNSPQTIKLSCTISNQNVIFIYTNEMKWNWIQLKWRFIFCSWTCYSCVYLSNEYKIKKRVHKKLFHRSVLGFFFFFVLSHYPAVIWAEFSYSHRCSSFFFLLFLLLLIFAPLWWRVLTRYFCVKFDAETLRCHIEGTEVCLCVCAEWFCDVNDFGPLNVLFNKSTIHCRQTKKKKCETSTKWSTPLNRH